MYYFIGMQNMEGGPVSILQPVLAYEGIEWTIIDDAKRRPPPKSCEHFVNHSKTNQIVEKTEETAKQTSRVEETQGQLASSRVAEIPAR